MAIYDPTKLCYKYNKETYQYSGVDDATLDTMQLSVYRKVVYKFPEDDSYFYTFTEPPVVDAYGVPMIAEDESLVYNPNLDIWNILKKYTPERPTLVKAPSVVYSDMNTRIMNYERDSFLTDDAKAVFQSIYRLITTEEGEIPYYRSYGCNLKRFIQKPLTEETATAIYNYLVEKVEQYETRGAIVSTEAGADLNNNLLVMKLYVQCKATGEEGVLPDLYVKVNRNRS